VHRRWRRRSLQAIAAVSGDCAPGGDAEGGDDDEDGRRDAGWGDRHERTCGSRSWLRVAVGASQGARLLDEVRQPAPGVGDPLGLAGHRRRILSPRQTDRSSGAVLVTAQRRRELVEARNDALDPSVVRWRA
jgi:hypothetical protein